MFLDATQRTERSPCLDVEGRAVELHNALGSVQLSAKLMFVYVVHVMGITRHDAARFAMGETFWDTLVAHIVVSTLAGLVSLKSCK